MKDVTYATKDRKPAQAFVPGWGASAEHGRVTPNPLWQPCSQGWHKTNRYVFKLKDYPHMGL